MEFQKWHFLCNYAPEFQIYVSIHENNTFADSERSLEEIWNKQGKYWIQLLKSSLQPIYIWKAYKSQYSIKILDSL